MKISVKKLTVYLLYLQIILYSASKLILYGRGTWASNATGTFYSVKASVGSVDQILLLMSSSVGILLSLIGLIYFARLRKKSGIIMGMLYVLCMVFWALSTVYENSFITLFVGSFTPLSMLCVGIYFIGFDDEIFNSFVRTCGIFATVFLSISLFYAVQFIVTYGGVGVRFGTSHCLYFFQYGLWTLAAFLMGTETNYFRKIKIILLGILLILSLVTLSRGWIVQSLILLFFFVHKSYKEGGKQFPVRQVLMVVFVGVVLYFVANRFLSDQLVSLFARANDDTRSQQLMEFFSQQTVLNLITGQGYNATYDFSWMSSSYGSIDNQILMIIFRYGIVALIPYVSLFVTPIWRFVRGKNKDYAAVVSMMWVLALLGLSIYCAINIDVAHVVVLMMTGHAGTDRENFNSAD